MIALPFQLRLRWLFRLTRRAAAPDPGTDLHLSTGAVRSFDTRPGRPTLACLRGTLWVTLSGDPRDYILRPGDQFTPRVRGTLVVQALQPGCLRVRRCTGNGRRDGNWNEISSS